MFTNEIIKKRDELVQIISDYEIAIRALRPQAGHNWERDIDNDTKPVVKKLYENYCKAKIEYNNFIDNVWTSEDYDEEIIDDKIYTSKEMINLILSNKLPFNKLIYAYCDKEGKTSLDLSFFRNEGCRGHYYVFKEKQEKKPISIDFFRCYDYFKITNEDYNFED